MIKLTSNAFLSGETPTLDCILENREARVSSIQKLLMEYPVSYVVCFKLNIPGPIKMNYLIQTLFNEGIRDFLNCATQWKVLKQKIVGGICGPEAFFVLEGLHIKEMLIELEDSTAFRRLYDFDVTGSDGVPISRSDFGIGDRPCLICNKSSKVCGRSRTHSVEDLHKKMIEILVSERSDMFYE